MAEEIDSKYIRISNFQSYDLDQVDLDLGSGHMHTIVHHSLTCTNVPRTYQISYQSETLCEQTDRHRDRLY